MIWAILAVLVLCGALLVWLESCLEHKRRVRRTMRLIERYRA